MKPERIEDMPGHWRQAGTQRQYDTCPVHGASANWKVYLDPVTGVWHCFAGHCGASGRVRTFDSPDVLRERLFGRAGGGGSNFEVVDLPDFEPLPDVDKEWLYRQYQLTDPERYLLVRGAYDGDYESRVIIPYLNRTGEIVYFNSRSMLHWVKPKYKAMQGQHPLYVPDYAWNKIVAKPVVVVEGAFDAMSIHNRLDSVYPVALGGKALPRHLELSMKVLAKRHVNIIVMLDRDAGKDALRLRNKLAGMLPRNRVSVVFCPGNDPASTPTHDLKEVLP